MSVAVGSRADQAVEIVILAAWRIAPFFAIAAAGRASVSRFSEEAFARDLCAAFQPAVDGL